ncbi:hypothetical protein [Pantoea sp. At-9b]|uniref:hypothetical protein n=1 Tax=Pantoea sp. (strain At-9b) TaxID=592316 RepID=UPI0001B3F1DC|nr:hypothetical protein [Pantoea sp. At-9b]ADU69434.1 hypothetical protein Pat9b_2122 [Pantoea sp. At-9b]
MALVKILSNNVFAGANFQKLEVGKVYDVDSAIAEKWIGQKKAEASKEKGGEKLTFEVATPSVPVSADASALQTQLDAALAQVKQLQEDATAKDTAHAEALAAETKRADDAVAALAATTTKDK